MENREKVRLNLGAGSDLKEGWINHDIVQLPGIDVVHDLNNFPWPWDDNSIDEIYMKDVLEHLPDTIRVMEEIYRICKPGAKIYIAVPYWNSYEAVTDPTHKSYFNEFTFDFFDPGKRRCRTRPYYTNARFKIVKLGFGLSFFRPYIQLPIISKYFVVYNNIIKWFIGLLASVFNNIIVGLEVYLEKE
jgi:SAM-dependent methyltransferase